MQTELLALKSKVCGFEQTSRKFRKMIAKSKGDRRWQLRYRKMCLGEYTREHLIAYGLLRGVPYSRIEGKCGDKNEPNVKTIHAIVQAHVPWNEKQKWTEAHVSGLLART